MSLFLEKIHNRSWTLGESSLQIIDRINGTKKTKIDVVFHLHPELNIISYEKKQALIDVSGNRVLFTFRGEGELKNLESSFHPRFGVSIKNRKLVFQLEEKLPQIIETEISW